MDNFLKKINNKNLINGNFIEYDSDHIKVFDPATLNEIGQVPSLDEKMLQTAIDAAVEAFKDWSQTLPKERALLLRKWQDLIIANIEGLAELLTLEQGKPFEDAKKEIMYGANFIGWFASQIMDLSGHITTGTKENQKIIIEYESVGVVVAITPWNFPSAMITRKIAPALAAGCTIILKPSELTPFSSLVLGLLARDAGFPKGVINIVTGDANLVSDVFAKDKRVRKLSFTGSTRVGKLLYEKSAATLKRLSLELGGNAPFIVLSDADLEKSCNDLINAKIRSTGQACTAPNRIFLHQEIYEKFIGLLHEKIKLLKVGNGFNKSVNISALINKAAITKILRLIKDATNKGAKILLGGIKTKEYYDQNNIMQKTNENHNFLEPTLLINCTSEMRLFKEEIFGPVFACYNFLDDEQLIALANDSDYGLASYIYTSNHNKAWSLASELDYGIVGVNESIISNEIGAFGGRKDSGFGVEGSKLGIYEYLNTKYKCVNY